MSPTPIARGSLFAIGAAVLFGGTAPLVKYFGAAPHRHDAVEHEHPHGSDLHHRHSH